MKCTKEEIAAKIMADNMTINLCRVLNGLPELKSMDFNFVESQAEQVVHFAKQGVKVRLK